MPAAPATKVLLPMQYRCSAGRTFYPMFNLSSDSGKIMSPVRCPGSAGNEDRLPIQCRQRRRGNCDPDSMPAAPAASKFCLLHLMPAAPAAKVLRSYSMLIAPSTKLWPLFNLNGGYGFNLERRRREFCSLFNAGSAGSISFASCSCCQRRRKYVHPIQCWQRRKRRYCPLLMCR